MISAENIRNKTHQHDERGAPAAHGPENKGGSAHNPEGARLSAGWQPEQSAAELPNSLGFRLAAAGQKRRFEPATSGSGQLPPRNRLWALD